MNKDTKFIVITIFYAFFCLFLMGWCARAQGVVRPSIMVTAPVDSTITLDKLEATKGFMLKIGSPCIGKGVQVYDKDGKPLIEDFFGSKINPNGPLNIGPYQGRFRSIAPVIAILLLDSL